MVKILFNLVNNELFIGKDDNNAMSSTLDKKKLEDLEKEKKKKEKEEKKRKEKEDKKKAKEDNKKEKEKKKEAAKIEKELKKKQAAEKAKKKKKKAKKSKKRRSSSSSEECSTSSSSDSSDSSSSSSSSSSSDSDSDDNSDDPDPRVKVLNQIWPKDKRPEGIRSKKDLSKFTSTDLKNFFDMKTTKEKAEKANNYEILTKDVKPPKKRFKKGSDDCASRLHAARWERLPVVHPKKFWKNLPVSRSNIFRNMELGFYGVSGKVADKVIVSMHDRAVPLQAKHFLSENATVAAKPRKEIKKLDDEGISSTIDFSWESPTHLSQLEEAVNNYMFLLWQIWPLDPTAMIMNYLLTTYKWLSAAGDWKVRKDIVTAYFNTVLRINAGRATNKQVVLSHSEHEQILKDCMIKQNVRPEIPLYVPQIRNTGPPVPVNQGFNSQHGNPPQAGRQGRQATQGPRKKIIPGINGVPCCYIWNSMDRSKKCRNSPTSDGCRDQNGKMSVHVCNMFVPNKNGHCLGNHKRRDHR